MSWLVLLVGLASVLTLKQAKAQQEVLDSLINLALKNNPSVSAAAYMRQSTASNTRGAGALPDPALSIGVMNLPANSLSLDETPMSGISIGLMQKFPWPGKLGARTELSKAHLLESEAGEQIVRNQTVREVTDAYLDYSYWSQSLPIINEYLDLLEGTRDIVEVRYANGKVPAQDLLRAGSKVSRTRVRLLRVEQNRYSSLLNLRRIAGDTTISKELPAYLSEPEFEPADSATIETNPLLAREASVVKQSETRRRMARLEYWPDITLGVDYGIRRDIPGDPVHGADFLTFKASFNLPLWFFAKQRHQVRSAEEMILASEQKQRAVRDLLTTRFNDAVSNLSVTLESLDTYDKSLIPEASAAMEAAEIAYEVGRIDFNALLSAQSDAFELKLERLDLLRQFHKTRAALAELSGNAFER